MYKGRFAGNLWGVGLALGVALACLSSAWAATYYVAPPPLGDDANTGTDSSQPWATIQNAADTMVAGDTVLVASGTYDERILTVRDGSPGNFITFQAEGLVEMNGFRINHDYIRVDGFDISGSPVPFYEGAIQIMKDAAFGELLNNKIHDLSDRVYGIYFYAGGTLPEESAKQFLVRGNQITNINYFGIALQGTDHLIENNRLDSLGGYDACRTHGRDHIIRGNIFANINEVEGNSNHTDIFQTFGNNGHWSYNILIERNIIKNSNCMITMLEHNNETMIDKIRKWTFRNNLFLNVNNYGVVGIPEVQFYNNTFYGCAFTNGFVIYFAADETRKAGHYGKMINNLFIGCGYQTDTFGNWGWYAIEEDVIGFYADHNYVAGPEIDGYPSKAEFNEPHGINGGDPLFFSENDFHLQTGSPAIDSGTTVSGMTARDLTGTDRVGLWDIGAFEYLPGYAGLDAPSNLQIVD